MKPFPSLTLALVVASLPGCGDSSRQPAADGGFDAPRGVDVAAADVRPTQDARERDAPREGAIDAGTDGVAADASAGDAHVSESSTETGVDSGLTADAAVQVLRTTKLGTIGPGFAGLSYEKSHLNDGFFTGTNADLIGLFKRLGPSVLRIGGNSVDTTTWSATGAGDTTGVIAPADVDGLAAFLAATGWTVIYGVNLAADDSTLAAAEAKYVSTKLGGSLYGFEIGNECDEYSHNGIRASTYSYADFLTQWQAFYTAMHAAAPAALFTGPASAANYATWTVPFAASATNDIVLLTQHYYRGNGMAATSTLTELLEPDPSLATELPALAKASTTNHIERGYRLAEANSFYNGGAPGISDGYGTALWVTDFLFTNAQDGSVGVNFHGGGDTSGYTPIADLNSAVVEARPDYYGMLLFTLAGQGEMFGTTLTVSGDLNVSAYAVGPSDGSTNVVLVNKDTTHTVHATVDLGKTATSGTSTLLTGPSLGATSGFTLGGVPINKDGSWTPASEPSVTVSATTFVVNVPAASAMVVRIP